MLRNLLYCGRLRASGKNDLIKFDFDFIAKYSKEMRDKITKYKEALTEYDFSIVEIKDASIEVATYHKRLNQSFLKKSFERRNPENIKSRS